jgi:hypothetical protein
LAELGKKDSVLSNIIDNIIEDIKPPAPVVIEQRRKLSLSLTVEPDTTAVFKRNGSPLGLECDAASEVDNNIVFQWTKDGRFIATTSRHVRAETRSNGKQANTLYYKLVF